MEKRLFDTVILVLCLLLYGYFGWHYYHGSRSAYVLATIEVAKADLHGKLSQEMERRHRLEAKVELLRSERLDADFLDELARAILNQVGERELIILK
jgi:cell division protein FtsB